MKLRLLILLFAFVKIANSQITFQKTFGGASGDLCRSVQQTAGGYIIVGSTKSFGAGLMDVYMIMTDSNGIAVLAKQYGGTGDDYGYSVQLHPGGGYIIAGYTNSKGAGNDDIYLARIDWNGNVLSSATFGGAGDDRGYSVQFCPGGGYIVAGYTNSFSAGTTNAYLVKTNSSGNLIWSKTYGGTSGGSLGLFGQETSDGGFVTAGYTNSFGSGGLDFYIIKTNGTGESGCYESAPNTIVSSTSTTSTGGLQVWSGGNFTASATTVTGSGGTELILCSCTISIQNFNTSNVSCYGGIDGSATVNINGGSPPYTYQWSNGQTNQTASNLSAGTYTVIFSATSSCTKQATVNIIQPTPLTAT